jgi:hypothetical protein
MIIKSMLDYWKHVARQVLLKYPQSKSDTIWTWKNFKDDILSLRGRLGVERTHINFLGLSLNFETGETIDDFTGKQVNTDDLVMYFFYYSKAQEAEASNQWVNYKQLTGTCGSDVGFDHKNLEAMTEKYSQNRKKLFTIIEQLGGKQADYGDTGYILTPLPCFRLLLVFHDKDDEFPASVRFLYNQHTIYFQPPEFLGVIASLTLNRIVNLTNRNTET